MVTKRQCMRMFHKKKGGGVDCNGDVVLEWWVHLRTWCQCHVDWGNGCKMSLYADVFMVKKQGFLIATETSMHV